jgi:hypothetical protein
MSQESRDVAFKIRDRLLGKSEDPSLPPLSDPEKWVMHRIAELRADGDDRAAPRIEWRRLADGRRYFSVQVRRGDGLIEAPPTNPIASGIT